MTDNKYVLEFVEKYKNLFKPDDVVWVDESKDQHKLLVSEAIAEGEVIKLSNSMYPGCLLLASSIIAGLISFRPIKL